MWPPTTDPNGAVVTDEQPAPTQRGGDRRWWCASGVVYRSVSGDHEPHQADAGAAVVDDEVNLPRDPPAPLGPFERSQQHTVEDDAVLELE